MTVGLVRVVGLRVVAMGGGVPVGAAFGGTLVTGGTLFSVIMEQADESSTPDPLSVCGGGFGWRESVGEVVGQ